MITTLVQSAFQTGYLSVESEGLIRQVLSSRGYKGTDLEALKQLYDAIQAGRVRREAHRSIEMPLIQYSR